VVLKPDANQEMVLLKTLREWWPCRKVTMRELSILFVCLLISVLSSTMVIS
jgi:hypothetical protein